MEQEVHERMVAKLNPPKFETDLRRDWKNDLYMNQISYQRNDYKPASNAERIVCAVVIAAIVFIAWYYSPAINYVLQGGVK